MFNYSLNKMVLMKQEYHVFPYLLQDIYNSHMCSVSISFDHGLAKSVEICGPEFV